MRAAQTDSSGATGVPYILSVPLAGKVERQWPQMGKIVPTAELDAPMHNFNSARTRSRTALNSCVLAGPKRSSMLKATCVSNTGRPTP